MSKPAQVTLALLALCPVAALAQPTATLALGSSFNGAIVPGGSMVDWTISVTASTGDNLGLALIACNLEQDPGNPQLFDLPPGDPNSIPPTMQNFDRPAGITNPGEGGAASGYIGVRRGNFGQMNLTQIGGGQNNFGEALPPGTGVAENANLVGGVGQGGPQEVLSGSFAAPSACGSYTFSLTNGIANVLSELNTPPDFSPVQSATVSVAGATITFTVTINGDLDGDFDVDLGDLATLLGNYGAASGMTYADGDLDGDGDVDLGDLATMLGSYGLSC